jgi:hypothetical protein
MCIVYRVWGQRVPRGICWPLQWFLTMCVGTGVFVCVVFCGVVFVWVCMRASEFVRVGCVCARAREAFSCIRESRLQPKT